jgi:PAS domain S-box-containing protein
MPEKRWYESLFEYSGESIFLVDPDTLQFADVNPNAARRLGYSRRELMQLTLDDVEVPCGDEGYKEAGWESTVSGTTFCECRYRHKEGHEIPVEVSSRVIEHGGQRVLLNVVRDISWRKEAETALQERERFLTTLNDITRAALDTPDLPAMMQTLVDRLAMLFGADGCCLFLWNEDKQTSILMASCGQWQGQYGSLDDQLGEKTMLAEVLETGEPLTVEDLYDSPYLHVHSAELFPGRSWLGLPLIAAGRRLGVALVAFNEPRSFTSQDVAHGTQTAGQIALAVAKAQLVEELRERNVELADRNQELDAFARTVAHDLKNPLGAIVGYAEFFGEDLGQLMPEELGFVLGIITRSAQDAVDIVDRLLLLARVRKGEVEVTALDMAAIVARARKRLQRLVEETRAEILQPATWPVALGYGAWIEEVWANYVGNGLKYGGHPPKLELGADPQPEGMIRFWIRDQGPGIPPQDQARLFTEFTRLRRDQGEGHGLGLSIVRRIVEKLGGEVGVESSGMPGQGSTFYFTLPQLDPFCL